MDEQSQTTLTLPLKSHGQRHALSGQDMTSAGCDTGEAARAGRRRWRVHGGQPADGDLGARGYGSMDRSVPGTLGMKQTCLPGGQTCMVAWSRSKEAGDISPCPRITEHGTNSQKELDDTQDPGKACFPQSL